MGIVGRSRYDRNNSFRFHYQKNTFTLENYDCSCLRKNTYKNEHITRKIKWNIVNITRLNNNNQEMYNQLGGNQKAGMFISLTALTHQENSA